MKEQKIKIELIICVSSTIIILILAAAMLCLIHSSDAARNYVGNLTDGWVYEDGNEAHITKLNLSKEHFSISRCITEEDPMNTDLCFVSKNIFLKVYCGDELVYDYHPDIHILYGKAYGSYAHCINLPEYNAGTVLRIDIDAVYHNSGFLNEMSFMNAGTFMEYQVNLGMTGFIICIISFIYGVILLSLSLFGSIFKERRNGIAAIAAFAIISSVWAATGTGTLQIITARPEVVHFVDYISLMFLSYPAVIYVAYVTGNENSRTKHVAAIITFVNLLATVCMNLLGIKDYHELLTGTHIIIAFSIIMIGYMIVQGFRRKTIEQKIYRFLVIAFSITVFTGAIDLFKYTMSGNRADTGNTFRIGLFSFIIIVGGYELTVILEMSRKGQQAEIMEQIAYHDALTGLFNRQAFLREEKALLEKDSGEYIIVQFDVNNLKVLNDTYGHNMGDKLIIGAAAVIKESFGAEHCFRTGGDEFIAIIQENKEGTAFKTAEEHMAKMLKEYSRANQLPIELSIAYGYTTYDASTKDPESAEHLADEKMYEMKKKMKAAMLL